MSWPEIGTMMLGLGLGMSALFGIAAGPLIARDYLKWAGAHRQWKLAAEKAGLAFSGRFVLSRRWKIEGRVGDVEIDAIATPTKTTVEAGTLLSSSVSVAPARFTGTASTGDAQFDRHVSLSATPLEIAALDAETRDRLRAAVDAGVTAANGRARFLKPFRVSAAEHPIAAIVNGVVTMANAFPVRSLADQVALAEDNAAHDRSASFRRLCMRALAAEPTAAEAYARAASNAAYDSDPVMRSFHVIRDGSPESRLDLVSTLAPEHIEPLLLDAVVHDARPRTEAVLLTRLRDAVAPLLPHLVRALGKIGGRDSVQPLHDITPGILGDRELRREITDAIAAIQSRLENAGEGQLAIAADDASGALSEAQKAGALSLPQRK